MRLYGFNAKLSRPKLTAYRVADPARPLRFTLNQYQGALGTATIGAAVTWRSKCLSLTWARPKVYEIRKDGSLWREP